MAVRTTQFFVELLLLGPAPDEFTHISTGIIGLSGLALSASPVDSFFYTFEGGFSLNGEADSYISLDLLSDGPLFLFGDYDLEIIATAYEFESYGYLSIFNFSESDTSFTIYGTGYISLVDSLSFSQDFGIFATGGISITNVLASLTIGSPPFAFTWKIKRRDTVNKSFTWATNTGRINHFYRVTGKIRKPIYKPITIPDYGNSASVVLLHASSVAEVCRKLRSRNFIHPILKIEQYTNKLNPNVAYTELTDVTPTYRLLPCAEFFIDFDSISHIVASCYSIVSIPPFETIGQITLSNINNVQIGITYDSQGSNFISGEADFSISF
jgi:hypothetical protein